jgi:hypothetical protein
VRRVAAPVLAALVLAARVAGAAPPSPLNIAGLTSFPGAVVHPSSPASAGCALADRWLGEEPFDNPAAAPASGVMLSPALVRLRRQDLAARYTGYDQTPAFVDGAGARLVARVRGVGLALYADQPVLRREDAVFVTSSSAIPGSYASTIECRETRTGVALSLPWRSLRAGAALEWTRRDDSFDLGETSGDPLAGTRHLEHAGRATGWQVGVRDTLGPRVALGAALRRIPALALTGRRTRVATYDAALDVNEPVRCARTAAWEGGVSARVTVAPTVHALVGAGARGAQEWRDYGLVAGPAFTWSLGVAWSDPEEPVTVRAGFGQEQQRGVPEPRAGLYGLGLGWTSGSLRLEAAVLHRSLRGPGGSTLPDDRVLAGVAVDF